MSEEEYESDYYEFEVPEEEYEEEARQQETEEEYEEPVRDMSTVFEKMLTPKSKDQDTTRDIKLTKSRFEDRIYLIRIKTMIHLCHEYGLKQAEIFYRELHHHYSNLLASDGGFTAKNIVTARQMITKEDKNVKKGGWFK